MSAILLIDDMKGVRHAVASVLKSRGHVITEADDGNKGLALLRGGQKFDLVITDVLMPQCDGTEVIMYLDEMPNRPPILAISGGGNQVSSDVALSVARSKADAVLAKPFENAELIATVDRLIKTKP